MKQERVSMPMSSAGIMGMTSDMKIGGYEVDPKIIIVFAFVFAVVIKLTTVAMKYL